MITRTLLGGLLTLPALHARSRNWAELVKSTELHPLDPNVNQYFLQTDPLNTNNNDGHDPDDSEFQSNGESLGSNVFPEDDDDDDDTTDDSTNDLPQEKPNTAWKPPRLPLNNDTRASPDTTITSQPQQEKQEDNDDDDDDDDIVIDTTYPEQSTPVVHMPWYFNYDSNSEYGPGEIGLFSAQDGSFQVGIQRNNWGHVEVSPDSYWKEFTAEGWGPWQGVLDNHDLMDRNMCETGNMQSPIDVRDNGAACVETHQIHSFGGDFRVASRNVRREIHSNKLRLNYGRRPCDDFMNNPACAEPDPPFADFPNGWGGYADVIHVDFKVPGEHRIWNEKFDAEMQIYHLHTDRRRLPTQAVPIRARQGGHNHYFHEALMLFVYEYKMNKAKCARRLREKRRLHSEMHRLLGGEMGSRNETDIDYDTWADFSTDLEEPGFEEESLELQRRLHSTVWDPHHSMLVPSIYFYRYDGSLTEPPCSEIVSWFVCDRPMIISLEQLELMKRILFTNVDENCLPTSIHHDESVARPIRPIGERPVWRCTAEHYGPA